MKLHILFVILSTTIILTLNGCDNSNNSGGTTEPENQTPTADAGVDKTIQVNQTVNITGSGSDTDGNITSYQWKEGNTILADTASFSYTATTTGTNILTLIVTDDDGATGNDTINITVKPRAESQKIVITEDYQVESLGTKNEIRATVSLGNTAKSLYLLLSNNAQTSAFSIITHNAKVTKEADSKTITSANFAEKPVILHTPQYVQDFSPRLNTLLSKKEKASQPQAKTIDMPEKLKDTVGTQDSFCVNLNPYNGDCSQSTTATARKVISNITTHLGSKTLNVWVSDNSFDSGSGCSKSKCVTQTMVDNLAKTFLMSGLNNDIYDWVSNIYGEEWENNTNGYEDLISANDEITILLTDIDENDSPDGGVVGFFWAKDNLKKSSVGGSNERVMFYIDAVMFANTDHGDLWQKEIYSTLAHEFQHMINFYQKRILLDTDIDVWINEMLSETTEDLIATKIKHSGPRGVTYTDGSAGEAGNTKGRYPLFNKNNTLSLTNWTSKLADYSKVNAFGTYLIRNYGGAKLLHDIMHNTYSDEQSVVDAVNKSAEGSGKTFDNLLSEWGVAVLLSDHENLIDVPFYNTGDFTENSYNNSTYDMGSINFFNYDPLPTTYTNGGNVSAQGNYYYKIGDNLTGDIMIDLMLNGQTEATLIAK